jgi:uncharacterized protein YkwD
MKYILSLALLSCIGIEAATAFPSTGPGKTVLHFRPAPAMRASMADDILKYVNEYRRRKRLPALAMNGVMSAEAQKHSENMAAHRTAFGHSGFRNRMKRILPKINGNGSLAENVAYGSTSAKQVVERWLKSPVHRENIEGPYNLTGIGIATDRSGDLYFTQIFAAR